MLDHREELRSALARAEQEKGDRKLSIARAEHSAVLEDLRQCHVRDDLCYLFRMHRSKWYMAIS